MHRISDKYKYFLQVFKQILPEQAILKICQFDTERGRQNSILEKVRQVIEDEDFYCHGNASLEELSRRIKESRHSVSQVINELLGKSFFEYLAEQRISKSRSLLSDPKYQNITIDEISFMVGYNSRSAFNRVFKSITGTTPDKYRKENPKFSPSPVLCYFIGSLNHSIK